MTLEVRQLVIKSSVSDGEAPSAGGRLDDAHFRDEILADCRSWLMEYLRQQQER